MLRTLASRVPQPLVHRLENAQLKHPLLGRLLLRPLALRVAHGETTIRRGPAAGLRIDATGTNSFYVLGTNEPEEQAWLAQSVVPGQAVYEIGANIGFHTLLLARLVTRTGRVYAFEPLPASASQLHKNVALNDFRHVQVIGAAVGASDGKVLIHDADGTRVQARVVGERLAPGDVEVEAVAIDNWFERENPRPPAVMKIDVEGAELDVLEGAIGTIRRWKPALLVEVHFQGSRFTEFAHAQLEPLGYRVTTVTGEEMPSTPDRFHAIATVAKSNS